MGTAVRDGRPALIPGLKQFLRRDGEALHIARGNAERAQEQHGGACKVNAVPFPAGEEKIGDKILAFRRKRRVKCIGAAAADHILHPGDGVVKFERAALHSKCIKQAGAQFLRHVKIVIIDKGGIG